MSPQHTLLNSTSHHFTAILEDFEYISIPFPSEGTLDFTVYAAVPQ